MNQLPVPPEVHVREATWPQDVVAVAAIIAEYVASIHQPSCFVGIAAELAHLPVEYAAPKGGVYLAMVNGELAGCCCYRDLPDTDHTNAGEMRRLFVRPSFRRLGLGHALAETVREAATMAGYSCLLLDTLTEMEAARALYEDMGFVQVAPYSQSPIPGAHHLKLVL